MKKIIILALALSTISQVFAYKYTFINQTRGDVVVYMGFSKRPFTVKAGDFLVHKSGGVCHGKFDVEGASAPIGGMTARIEVKGNPCWDRQYFIQHKNPKYITGKTQVLGSNRPSLPIAPNTGQLVIVQR